jgi:hypothetical protein
MVSIVQAAGRAKGRAFKPGSCRVTALFIVLVAFVVAGCTSHSRSQ